MTEQEGGGSSPVASLQEIKLYGSRVTRATFHELEVGGRYVLQVFTLCGDQESDSTMLEGKIYWLYPVT